MARSTWAERQWQALAREGYRFDPESSSMRTERYTYPVPKGEREAAKAASDAEQNRVLGSNDGPFVVNARADAQGL